MDTNGNVFGKNVVGKHLIMVMVGYIGGEEKRESEAKICWGTIYIKSLT
jgi:hypothetical protein